MEGGSAGTVERVQPEVPVISRRWGGEMRSGGQPSYIPLAENNMVTEALPMTVSMITPRWTALADIRRPLRVSLTPSQAEIG